MAAERERRRLKITFPLKGGAGGSRCVTLAVVSENPHSGSGEWSHGCQWPALGERNKPRGGSGQVPPSVELWKCPCRRGFQGMRPYHSHFFPEADA